MAAFERHRRNSGTPYGEGCGGLMWDAWGGDEGVAIAGGLARVAVISQQKFDSPSTAGGGGNPGGSIPGSQFGAGTTTIAGATGTLQSPTLASAPPVRAYVVTGDVRDGLEAESVLNTRRQFP